LLPLKSVAKMLFAVALAANCVPAAAEAYEQDVMGVCASVQAPSSRVNTSFEKTHL
jgi:hypothetical protein